MRAGTKNKIKIIFIRHGETASNALHRYLGKTDEGLSEEGIMKLEKKKYRDLDHFENIEYIFSGPMMRCRQTAEVIFKEKQVELVEKLTEIDFGDFEGKSFRELDGDKDYQDWIDSNGTLPFPNGEGRDEFIKRSLEGFEDTLGMIRKKVPLIKRESEKDEQIPYFAVVLHGGNIMAILSELAGGDYFDYQVGNGNGYGFTLEYIEQEKEVHYEVSNLEKLFS